jgi:hypothetical protein
MLREITNVRQIAGDGRRRWFRDEYFDLIVWYSEDGMLTGFQLCYDRQGHERAFTWGTGHGCVHVEMDDGELPGHSKMAPVLRESSTAPEEGIQKRFLEGSLELNDRAIVRIVYEAVDACCSQFAGVLVEKGSRWGAFGHARGRS